MRPSARPACCRFTAWTLPSSRWYRTSTVTFVDLAYNRGLQPSRVVLARIEAKEDTTLLGGQAEGGQEVDVPSSEQGCPDLLCHSYHLPRLAHSQQVNYWPRRTRPRSPEPAAPSGARASLSRGAVTRRGAPGGQRCPASAVPLRGPPLDGPAAALPGGPQIGRAHV